MKPINLSLVLLFTTINGLSQCPEFTVDLEISHPLCHDSEDGLVEITATGGTAPYWYEIYNDADEQVNVPGTNFASELPAGIYSYIITDEIACDTSNTFTIYAPEALYFTEFDGMDLTDPSSGIVFMSASGGTGVLDYLWTALETGITYNNTTWGGRDAGCYVGTVTDENSCQISDTICIGWLNVENYDLDYAQVAYSAITNSLDVTYNQPFQLNIYALNGQLVFTKNFGEGKQSVQLSLNPGVYIYTVNSKQNAISTGRITI